LYRVLFVVTLTSAGLLGAASRAVAGSPAALGAPVTTRPTAARPAPRTDRNSQLAHGQLVEKARTGRIDVYFLGDSITRRWGTSDEQYKHFLANWRENFFGWNAANFGWGGDQVQNILWRVENGELDGVNPKVIVLLAGTNNIGDRPARDAAEIEARAADVAGGIKALVETCRQKAPGATIILTGITPRKGVMPIIDRVNQHLAALADGDRVRYVNVNDKLADDEGRFYEGMATDGLHLDVKGYQVWADALKPILSVLLGPPAKEDHAPPPTGDPSAKR
jgi:lysophospholipase L1-like esterase